MEVIRLNTEKNEEMLDISATIQREITSRGFKDGLTVIYTPHTTTGLTINEGLDPSVRSDILSCLSSMAPWDKIYGHAEGNSPAHVKAVLTGSSVTVLVENGNLILGQWQRIFFCEFDGPRPRQYYIKFIETK